MKAQLATLLLLATVALPQQLLAAPSPKLQEFAVKQGANVRTLQGSKLLMPKTATTSISITLVPVRIVGPINKKDGQPLINFTASAYVNDDTGIAMPFAPSLRLKRGGSYTIKLTNGLIQPATDHSNMTHMRTASEESGGVQNWWHNPLDTNLHTHGMHAELGVPSQDFAASGAYLAGDNPFFKLPARQAGEENKAPATKLFKLKIPNNHLPGLHWFHPHQHGSSVFQVGTAHGLIIIEDDNKLWLPKANGCAEFSQVLQSAPELILNIQMYMFLTPNPANQWDNNPNVPQDVKAALDDSDTLNNGNLQELSELADPENALCCDYNTTGGIRDIGGKAAAGDGLNVFLVNGGYQPKITLPSNVWNRWRFINTAPKAFTVVKIVDAATNTTTKDCELMLYAKDGVYLMQVPRKIDGMLLAAANRAEVLVRCTAPVGKKFYLWAGDSTPFSTNEWSDNLNTGFEGVRHMYAKQDILAVIEIANVRNTPVPAHLTRPLAERKCTPRRPHYVADLRDDNLAKHNYSTSDIVITETGFAGQDLTTVYNVSESAQNSPLSVFYKWGCGVKKSDGQFYPFSLPDPDPLVLVLGKIVQWNFVDAEFHPMHIHINPFQIQVLNTSNLCTDGKKQSCFFTSYFEVGDFHDTLTLPMLAIQSPEVPLPLRFQPGEYAGYTVMHCHFLLHEDSGCMTVVQYKCPSQPDDQQTANCPGFTWPVPADVAPDGTVVTA